MATKNPRRETGARVRLISVDDHRLIERFLATRTRQSLREGLPPAVEEALVSFVLAGGKRVRPQLVAWTWRSAINEARAPLSMDLLRLAAGWELFHAFLLIHDDLIDRADVRRSQPALQHVLSTLHGGCCHTGTSLAIVAGDLFFAAAMSLWHELELPPERFRDSLRLFSRIATLTGFGQAIDILQERAPLEEVDEAALLREYCWKTAAYTFEGPMLSAAIVAGLDEPARNAVSRFALGLGQAYQLQNDLLDLASPCHAGSDLVQGKRTVTLVGHRARLSIPERRELDERLRRIASSNGHAIDVAEELRRSLIAGGAARQTQGLIEQLLEQAESACNDPALPVGMGPAMAGLLARLREDYFREPSFDLG